MTSRRPDSTRSIRSAPPVLVVLAFAGSLLFILPLIGLMAEAPWSEIPSLMSSEIVVDALILSLITSIAAAVLSLLFGLPIAWILARVDVPGKSMIRSMVTLPMVLPPVVGGIALLFAIGRRGLLGQPLEEATGIVLPFSIWGVIIANTFVAMPFLVVSIEGALDGLDERIEHAAASMGATPLTVFRRITLPLIAPSIRAGVVLAWARALGEFGATITFAGNLQGRTQTLPLAAFIALESDRGAAITISLMLVMISLMVLVSLRGRWWTRS